MTTTEATENILFTTMNIFLLKMLVRSRIRYIQVVVAARTFYIVTVVLAISDPNRYQNPNPSFFSRNTLCMVMTTRPDTTLTEHDVHSKY